MSTWIETAEGCWPDYDRADAREYYANRHDEESCDHGRDYYDDYSYEESIYDACDGMEDAYWNLD